MDRYLDVLIVEDNPVNRMVAVRMLKKLGIRAGTAANGIEAIRSLERQPYDIVLMDIQMPEMNGIEATKIICDRWPEGPKIIVVTDYDSNRYRDVCLDAGASEFLNKPINMEELTTAIEHNISEAAYDLSENWSARLVLRTVQKQIEPARRIKQEEMCQQHNGLQCPLP
jgi:CheY-like chemotaxis protein